MNKIIKEAKTWIGNLLYSNGVHQREKKVFKKAEDELEVFILKALSQQKEVKEEKFRKLRKELKEAWQESLDEKKLEVEWKLVEQKKEIGKVIEGMEVDERFSPLYKNGYYKFKYQILKVIKEV